MYAIHSPRSAEETSRKRKRRREEKTLQVGGVMYGIVLNQLLKTIVLAPLPPQIYFRM